MTFRKFLIRFVLLLIFLSGVFTLVLYKKINPLTEQLACAVVSDQASNIINETILEWLTDEQIDYDDLISLRVDQQGRVTALTTNIQEINRLKTGLLAALDSSSTMIGNHQLGIPLGNFIGPQVLSGRGPEIPVEFSTVSSSDARFYSAFSEAGINQTLHRVMLEVSLELLILLPSTTVETTVSTEVCVGETVLLGTVPQQYGILEIPQKTA